jgi:hypothetical protein
MQHNVKCSQTEEPIKFPTQVSAMWPVFFKSTHTTHKTYSAYSNWEYFKHVKQREPL